MVKADTDFVAALAHEMHKQLPIKSVEQINPGGTLGIFFKGEYEGEKKFIKCHHPNGMAAKNLKKEIYLMQNMYEEFFGVKEFEIEVNGDKQHIMAMDFLEIEPLDYTIFDVDILIQNYGTMLRHMKREHINYRISDFENAAVISCEELANKEVIDKDTYIFCRTSLKNFRKYSEFEREICHGDLSNINIYGRNNMLAALDWEDAMECVPYYDMLYWLTFFSQRKFYGSLLFDELKINEQYGKDLMVMILVVKSYISFLNGTYKNNKLTIQDRLSEVIFM